MRDTDWDEAAELHRRVFGVAGTMTEDLRREYRAYFREVFEACPWRAGGIGPLVFEEGGRIAAMLGVFGRPLEWEGRRIQGAVTSQLVADPENRSMAGVQLLKACLQGPQDLTWTDEANGKTRAIWERLGGRVSYADSWNWIRRLRPARWVAANRRPGSQWWRRAAKAVDQALGSAPGSPFRRPRRDALVSKAMSVPEFVELIGGVRGTVVPVVDRAGVEWTMARLKGVARKQGELHAIRVEDGAGRTQGGFLLHVHPENVSRVVHVQAGGGGMGTGKMGAVLSHLFAYAWEAGCSAVGGRVSPPDLEAYVENRCSWDRRTNWFLVHGGEKRLELEVASGGHGIRPWFGEWPLHFTPGDGAVHAAETSSP